MVALSPVSAMESGTGGNNGSGSTSVSGPGTAVVLKSFVERFTNRLIGFRSIFVTDLSGKAANNLRHGAFEFPFAAHPKNASFRKPSLFLLPLATAAVSPEEERSLYSAVLGKAVFIVESGDPSPSATVKR